MIHKAFEASEKLYLYCEKSRHPTNDLSYIKSIRSGMKKFDPKKMIDYVDYLIM